MIRVTGDRVLVRPVRQTKKWVKDLAGGDAGLQRLAENLANRQRELDTIGEVVAVGERKDLAPLEAVRALLADMADLVDRDEAIDALDTLAAAPLEFAVGDIVLFTALAGQELHVDEEEFIVLREGDILGIVDLDAPAEDTEHHATA